LSPEEIASGTMGFWVHFNMGGQHHVTYLTADSPDLTPNG
jgi:hypothetical protein